MRDTRSALRPIFHVDYRGHYAGDMSKPVADVSAARHDRRRYFFAPLPVVRQAEYRRQSGERALAGIGCACEPTARPGRTGNP
ncbi:hypothetical protein QZM19_00285 [Burkholderia multivorans]|uniref:hypothetical protein n=1 Tax=Burkholderia multivorans TaxID=87883 RepID=UPI000D4C9F21|nr:hypothetical protein [Burkholderia multivorans]MDN7861818.1 hypothetical protein [Burkholderia multivorans]PRE97469.1 hypothetical protein C6Q05_19695 [Burkholderia multivorans]